MFDRTMEFRPHSRMLAAAVLLSLAGLAIAGVVYAAGYGTIAMSFIAVAAAAIAGIALMTRSAVWRVGTGNLTRREADGTHMVIPWPLLDRWEAFEHNGPHVKLHLKDGREIDIAHWEVADPGIEKLIQQLRLHSPRPLDAHEAASETAHSM
jgi:hypothetical protein